ncbi:MAG: hypothetical protein ABSG25_04815 [Bryobacteraceae bacterium]
MSSRKRPARLHTIDPFGWAVAGVLAFGATWFPQTLSVNGATKTVVLQASLFLAGAIVGALRPNRVWRWGIAGLLVFVLTDLFRFSSDPATAHASAAVVGAFLRSHSFAYVSQTIPLVIGAYIGEALIQSGVE